MDIARVICDKRLCAASLGDLATWSLWLVVLKAAFGLPLSADELIAFASVAGQRKPPTQRVRELWAIVGRRGGKSRMAALIAVFIALFVKHRLSPGEKGMVLIVAGSMDQATIVFDYVVGILRATPALRKEIASVRRHEITLRNGIVIAVHSNSFRNIRGRTLVACIFDEVATWRDETSATPDVEVYTAVLPALLTTGGMLVAISTGYRRQGLLYTKHRDHFGQDSTDTLVVQGTTLQFNQTLTEADLAAQIAADPAAAESEWRGGFRDDIASFLDDELIEAAIEHGRPLELPPRPGTYYRAFCDPSGGTGGDSYTLAVGHKQDGVFVVDVIRGTTGKIDPSQTTAECAALAKEYRCSQVSGDYYGAEWVGASWHSNNVTYIRSDLPKSQIYLETIPLFARGLVRLPDHPKLIRELRLLERRTHRSGKDPSTIQRVAATISPTPSAVCCGVCRTILGMTADLKAFNQQTPTLTARPINRRTRSSNYVAPSLAAMAGVRRAVGVGREGDKL